MRNRYRILAVVLTAWLSLTWLSGCSSHPLNDPPGVRPGFVTDMASFESFIATRPAPEDFRRVYPDVVLVMPGDVATREYRTNNSRYFVRLDDTGRIIGGQFQ